MRGDRDRRSLDVMRDLPVSLGMAADLMKELDRQISALQNQLSALRGAKSALSGGVRMGREPARRGRRTFTAAQRAEISKRMKAAWAKRRKGSGDSKR